MTNNRTKTLWVRPVGISLEYTDMKDEARYTDVNLYIDPNNRQLIAKSRKSGIFDPDDEENYKEIKVQIIRRILTFQNASLSYRGPPDGGSPDGLHIMWLQADDLIAVEDKKSAKR